MQIVLEYYSRTIETLYRIKSLNSSIRIDLKYRLEFMVRKEEDEEIVTICRLLDISNHYK